MKFEPTSDGPQIPHHFQLFNALSKKKDINRHFCQGKMIFGLNSSSMLNQT